MKYSILFFRYQFVELVNLYLQKLSYLPQLFVAICLFATLTLQIPHGVFVHNFLISDFYAILSSLYKTEQSSLLSTFCSRCRGRGGKILGCVQFDNSIIYLR